MKARAEVGAYSDATEADLWRAFKQEGSSRAREALFDLHSNFASGVARRHYLDHLSPDIELAELRQLAFAGLLEAIDHFRPDLGTPFRGYAAKRVSGSVVDGIAKLSEAREQISLKMRMRRERIRSLEDPGVEELAGGEAMQALADLAVGLAIGFMLEDTGLYQQDEKADERGDAYQTLAWSEAVSRMTAELARLDERERLIIRRHYVDGMNFEQIGQVLSLSKGRVSQLHRSAIGLLRKRLPGHSPFRLER